MIYEEVFSFFGFAFILSVSLQGSGADLPYFASINKLTFKICTNFYTGQVKK